MPETRPPLDINAAGGLDALAAVLAGRSRPPVERWNPEHCGDSGMRIDREGRWWHDGRPIVRPALVRLFASILRREPRPLHQRHGRFTRVRPSLLPNARVRRVRK